MYMYIVSCNSYNYIATSIPDYGCCVEVNTSPGTYTTHMQAELEASQLNAGRLAAELEASQLNTERLAAELAASGQQLQALQGKLDRVR